MKKCSEGWIFLKTSLANIFLEESGGKRILNKSSLVLVFWTGGLFVVYKMIFQEKKVPPAVAVEIAEQAKTKADAVILSYRQSTPVKKVAKPKGSLVKRSHLIAKIKYDAPQVIVRSDSGIPSSHGNHRSWKAAGQYRHQCNGWHGQGTASLWNGGCPYS